MKTLLFVVQILVVTRLGDSAPCSPVESLNITDGVVHPNGSIFLHEVEFTSDLWYEVQDANGTTRYGCPCIGRTCMFKCCDAREELYNSSCEETSLVEPFNPPLFNEKVPSAMQAFSDFYYLHRIPCADRYLVDTGQSYEELYIQENAMLLEVAPGGSQLHDWTRYCVDMRRHDETEPARLAAVICFPEETTEDDSRTLYAAYAAGLILSIPFLLATFLVYALIPELRNLHGQCLMAYCGGLLVGYPVLAYLKLHVGRVGVEMTGCYTMAFIIYYGFQTSFFWLNVMCFDIWRTFSGYRGGGSNKRRERRRFVLYGLYAWGVPLVLTGILIGMQFGDLPPNIITPGFGTRRCWFVNWSSEMVYFFTPVLVLVLSNITFFSMTAHRIYTIKQETAILKGAESSRSDKLEKDKQRFDIYLKLFMVMGVNWSVELISLALGGSNWFWIVIDISNIVLGIFIFFIFAWKKKVRMLVRKRFRSLFGMEPAIADSRAGRWTSNSAPTEDTRFSGDESGMRLKELH